MIVGMRAGGRTGGSEPGGDAVTRSGRRGLLTIVVVGAVTGATTVALTPLVPSPFSGGPVAPWRGEVADVLGMLALVMVVVGLVLSWRAGVFSAARAGRLRAAPRAQRRSARRCVLRGQSAPGQVGGLAAVLASSMARQGVMAIFLVGLALSQLWQALRTTNAGWVVLEAAVTALLVVAAVIVLLEARAARRWLNVYPPSPEQGAAR